MINSTCLKEVIKYLSDFQEHSIYSLHKEYNLSPAELLNTVQYLLSIQAISIDKRNIKLLKKNLSKNLQILALHYRDNSFNTKHLDHAYFEKNMTNKVEINELYLPDESLIDKSLKIIN